MVQRLLDDKLSSKETGDFSSLAWRFNNLNSTAKMLLVGATPSSVPFIPISELASNESNSYDLSTKANQVNNLSLSSLSSPGRTQVSDKPNFHAPSPISLNPLSSNPISPNRVSSTEQRELQEATPQIRNDFKTIRIAEESTEKSSRLSQTFSPVISPTKQEELDESNLDLSGENQKLQEKQTNKRVLINPKPILTDKLHTGYRASSLPQTNQSEILESKVETDSDSATLPFTSPLAQNEIKTQLPSNWSYKGLPPLEEENEYYSLKEELSRKSDRQRGIAPFVKNSVKAVAVLSLIALLGFGAYNLLRKPSVEKDIDTYVNETDPLNNDTLSESEINSISNSQDNESNTNYSSNSKTFFDEENKLPKAQKDLGTKDTYAPKILPKSTANTTFVKQKTSPYAAPSIAPKKVVEKTNISSDGYYTVNQADYKIKEEPVLLYDASSVYDSSASEAISPETYTAAKFPIELSYARTSSLYEAPLPSDVSSNVNSSSLESSSSDEPQEETANPERVTSGYPETSDTASPYSRSEKPSINQEIEETQNNLEDELTPEEKKIINSPKIVPQSFSSSNPYESNILEEKQNPTSNNLIETNVGRTTAPRIYSKPISEIEEIPQRSYTESSDEDLSNEDTSLEDKSLSVPILREPVRSSSNQDFLNSPIQSPYSSTPMTSSSYVPQQEQNTSSNSDVLPSPNGRNYTQAKRGKVVRFMDRFSSQKSQNQSQNGLQDQKSENTNNTNLNSSNSSSYQSKINELQRKSQDSNLSDFEKQELLNEVNSLKQEIINGSAPAPSKKRYFSQSSKPSNLGSSQTMESDLKKLESDASKVYIQQSPYSQAETEQPLNLSFLEN